MDVNNLLRTFERSLRGEKLSKNTIHTYLNDLSFYLSQKDCVKENVDSKKFSKAVSKESIVEYFQNIILSDKYNDNVKLKGKLRRTAAKKMSSFAKFFIYLEREEIIPNNYLKAINRSELIGKYEKSTEHKNYIDEKELFLFVQQLDILNKANKNDYILLRDVTILFILIFTGVRVTEVVNIMTSHVDFNNNYIHSVMRKGGKKTKIPIEKDFLKPAINDYKGLREEKPFENQSFFTNARGNPISRQTIYRMVEKYSLRFLNYRVHPHTFRHTFATCLLQNGATTAEVKTMLDHENITSTEVYEHVNEIKTKYNLINNFYKK